MSREDASDLDWFERELERERLHRAAEEGNLEEIESLLEEGFPINRFDALSWTPLHRAARSGKTNAVFLIKRGANINAQEEEKAGNTALGEIAANCTLEMARILVNAGQIPPYRGGWGLRH